jgi:hypothetical protein
MLRLRLYSRPGCHLCDEMKAVVQRLARRIPLTVDEVDISRSEDLEACYGLDIPVLELEGRRIAKHRVSEAALERVLTGQR